MKNPYKRKSVLKKKRFSLIGKRFSSGNKKLDTIIEYLFILGLILLVLEILLYRRTIIELKIPLIIWLAPGIILTPLLYNKLNYIDGRKAHWILHYFLHTGMTGSFIVFVFMASNFYFADDMIEEKRFEIFETGSMSGSKGERNKRKPFVMINYEGMEKQLIFPYNETDKVNSAKYVNLKVKHGLWGFDILKSYNIE